MRNNTRLALGGILLIAFILRVIGIRFGLPHLYHQDEPIVVNHAMAIGAGGWNTGVYWPPQFASYFLFLFYAVSFITGHLFGFFKNAEAFGTWFVKDPTYFYLLGRLVLGVGFGTATVWVMWRLGKDYFSQKTGLLTALFLAVCYVHVQHSHYIYVDIPLGFALALLFCAWLSLLKGFSIQKAFWVGLAFGWAVSVKYTAFYFAPVFLVLHILVFGKDLFSRRSFLGWLVEGAAALGIYALISPFTFLDWPAFIAEASSQSGARGYSGWLYHTVYSIIPGTSPLLFILAVLGLVYSFWNYRKEAVLLGSAALVYYLVNVYFTQPFARYMMPLILLVCLWAALGCLWAVSLIKKPMVKSMIIAATLLSTLVPSIYSDFLFLRKDTRTQCLEWIESRVPEGSVIVVDNLFYSPPLRQTREQIEEKYRSLGDQRGEWCETDEVESRAQSAGRQKNVQSVHADRAGRANGTAVFIHETFHRNKLE